MNAIRQTADARHRGWRVVVVATGLVAMAGPVQAVPTTLSLPTRHLFPQVESVSAGRVDSAHRLTVAFEQRSRGGGGSGGQAVPRGGSSGGSSGGGSSSGGTATTRSSGGSSGGGSTSSGDSGTTQSRSRGGRPATGQAVERPGPDGRPIPVPPGGGYWGGYYPWGWGGLGFSAYYGGFYDPWWYGGYPVGGYVYGTEGAVRLKVKPREAEVYVDGYFAGSVNDYDGTFQKLHLDPGPHRIEIRLDGYEPLVFEVRVQPDKTITYRGEMRKVPTP